ncbi:MAG: hypothetical protein ACQEQO_03435 [Thermodesulfobacteriota bacterium]
MKKVTEFNQKVKRQGANIVLNKAAWIIGIDIGQKRLYCQDLYIISNFNSCQGSSVPGPDLALSLIYTDTTSNIL